MTVHRLVAALLLLASTRAHAQRANAGEALVWSSLAECPSPVRMTVEIRAQGKLLHRTIFSLCHVRRADIPAHTGPQSTFTTHGGQTFQGEYSTARTDTIAIDLWEAGADPDRLLLGISFATRKQVLVNTIHLMRPGRRATDGIDAGFTVTSHPESSRQSSNVALQQTAALR